MIRNNHKDPTSAQLVLYQYRGSWKVVAFKNVLIDITDLRSWSALRMILYGFMKVPQFLKRIIVPQKRLQGATILVTHAPKNLSGAT